MKTFKQIANEAHIDNLRNELENKIANCNNAERLVELQTQLKDLLDRENKSYK